MPDGFVLEADLLLETRLRVFGVSDDPLFALDVAARNSSASLRDTSPGRHTFPPRSLRTTLPGERGVAPVATTAS